MIRYNVPLSSDAFRETNYSDPSFHEKNSTDAHNYLLNTTIPNFVKTLSERKVDKVHSFSYSIDKELHENGINLYYLGK